jgi:hypothetical protein
VAEDRPAAVGFDAGDLVDVEGEDQAGGVTEQLAFGDGAGGGLVGDEEHPVASAEAHDVHVVAVGGAPVVVSGDTGDGGDGPPLWGRLARPRLGTAVRDRALEGGGEGLVARVVEQRERRAVRRPVGGETVFHAVWLADARWHRLPTPSPGETGFVGVAIGLAVGTFGGAEGEANARAYDVFCYAFLAYKPG